MSTKLNADELAAKRYPLPDDEPSWDEHQKQLAYAAAIREVAQPIADERDELREALKRATSELHIMRRDDAMKWTTDFEKANAHAEGTVSDYRAILAKYANP